MASPVTKLRQILALRSVHVATLLTSQDKAKDESIDVGDPDFVCKIHREHYWRYNTLGSSFPHGDM